jgi:asparagine synthase (glutamine-hydrolysing)
LTCLVKDVDYTTDFYLDYAKTSGFKGLKLIQYIELKTILPDRMLYKLDRMSMHHGIEARSPFMDRALVELAFSIPTILNIGVRATKKLLRAILSGDFGRDFVSRPKMGFGNPVELWLQGQSRGKLLVHLNNPGSVVYKYLDYDIVQKTYQRFSEGGQKEDYGGLWRLIVLSHYLDRNRSYLAAR